MKRRQGFHNVGGGVSCSSHADALNVEHGVRWNMKRKRHSNSDNKHEALVPRACERFKMKRWKAFEGILPWLLILRLEGFWGRCWARELCGSVREITSHLMIQIRASQPQALSVCRFQSKSLGDMRASTITMILFQQRHGLTGVESQA